MLERALSGLMVVSCVAACGGQGDPDQRFDDGTIIELETLSEDEKIAEALKARGFDADTARFVDDQVIVEGDILFYRAELLSLADEAIEKGYWCGKQERISTPWGPGPEFCYQSPITSEIVKHIRLIIGPGFTNWQKKRIRNAARWWSYAHLNDGTGSNIYVDAEAEEPPSGWTLGTIRVDWGNLGEGGGGLARLPYEFAGLVFPGEQIYINNHISAAALQTNKFDFELIVTHELGHTLGFDHPETDLQQLGTAHIAGTSSGTNYNTVMHGEWPPSTELGLWADDARSAVIKYPNSCPELGSPNGDFCLDPDCPCDVGEGDCDSIGTGDQCKINLECSEDVGERYDLPASYDVCEKKASCLPFDQSHDNEYCDDINCPCGVLEGDCDTDAQCGGILECWPDVGAAVDKPDDWDLCVLPRISGCPVFDPEQDDGEFCTPGCPCNPGQGDCDDVAECRGGLDCARDVGAHFGLPANYDACVDKRLNEIDGVPITWERY